MLIAILVLAVLIFLFNALGFAFVCWAVFPDKEKQKIAELKKLKSDDIIKYINHYEICKAQEIITKGKQV